MPLVKTSLWRVLPWVYLSLLIALAVLLVVLLVASQVVGVEFNAESLEHRTFVVWRIPFTGVAFSPVFREETQSSPLGQFLREKQWWNTGQTAGSSGWLVAREISVRGDAAADADLLRTLLQSDRDTEQEWIRWSREHPDRAAQFWPAVASQVGKDRYLLLPDLFALALEKGDGPADWDERFRAWQRQANLP